jgi:hypothetical protein
MEKECSRCQAGDNPNHTHNTEYGKLARSKSKSSLSNPNHSSPVHSKALEGKKKEIAGKMKGKESLNIPRGEKNEGNKMEEGRNENNRA